MVDFDALLKGFTCLFVSHHDIAGKQLGCPGVVVLDHETLEVKLERQLLQQQPIAIIEQGEIACAAFGNQYVAAKTWVARCKTALRRNLANQRIALHRLLAAEEHLRAQQYITIEQAADADDDDAAVGKDIAQAVGAARLGGHHGAAFAHRMFGFEACLPQTRVNARDGVAAARCSNARHIPALC